MKAGWKVKPLGEVCKVIAGQSPKGSAYNDSGQGLPFYQGKKDFTERLLAPPTTWTSQITKEAEVGDILMSVRAPVGPINEAYERICIGRGLAAIRASKQVEKDYIWYSLLWKQPEISGHQGAVFSSINKAGIEAIEIPIPPLEEQKRIVAVLDAAFEGLTRAKENAEANLQNARDLFEGFASSAVEESLAKFPILSLTDVSDNLDRQRVPITKTDRVAGDVPYYGASGVVDHVKEHLFDEDLLLVSEDGANLLARTYPIAFSVSGKTWVNNHAHVLRFKDRSRQEFVSLYLNSISLVPYVSGMAQPKLNQKALNTIPIPDLPENVCATVVRQATRLQEAVETLDTNYRAKLTDIADLRQSLLQKAFAGELT